MEEIELDDDKWERLTSALARRADDPICGLLPDALDGSPCIVKITHQTPNGEEYIIYEKGSTEDDPESNR